MLTFYFVTINLYNGYLNMFYGTVFTNLIVFAMVFEEDIPEDVLENYPVLYKSIHGRG